MNCCSKCCLWFSFVAWLWASRSETGKIVNKFQFYIDFLVLCFPGCVLATIQFTREPLMTLLAQTHRILVQWIKIKEREVHRVKKERKNSYPGYQTIPNIIRKYLLGFYIHNWLITYNIIYLYCCERTTMYEVRVSIYQLSYMRPLDNGTKWCTALSAFHMHSNWNHIQTCHK